MMPHRRNKLLRWTQGVGVLLLVSFGLLWLVAMFYPPVNIPEFLHGDLGWCFSGGFIVIDTSPVVTAGEMAQRAQYLKAKQDVIALRADLRGSSYTGSSGGDSWIFFGKQWEMEEQRLGSITTTDFRIAYWISPLGGVAVGFAMVVLSVPIGFLHAYRWKKRERLGLCQVCGYDLHGSPERCPECGTLVADMRSN